MWSLWQNQLFQSEIGESDGMLSEALTKHFKPKAWYLVEQNNLFKKEGKPVGKILQNKSCLTFY